MDSFSIITSDSDGVTKRTDGKTIGKCWNAQGELLESGKWWLSPSCRSFPEHCVPFITGGDGWYMDEYMQKSIEFNIPLAIAVAKEYRQVERTWASWNISVYSYTTDVTANTPLLVHFPFHEASQWDNGKKVTQTTASVLTKWTSPNLEMLAHRPYLTAQKLQLSSESLRRGLLNAYNVSDLPSNFTLLFDAATSVACRWLKGNPSLWKPWVPFPTDCPRGFGLVDKTDSFVKEGKESAAVSCRLCEKGYVSVIPPGAESPLCDKCRKGTSQPSEGFRGDFSEDACPKCPSGTHAPVDGAAYCTHCPAGKYQNVTGQSFCNECPAGNYNVNTGSSFCNECEPGKFRITLLSTSTDDKTSIHCKDCAPDTFQALRGQTACERCKTGFKTKLGGVRSESDCVCREGSYYDVSLDECRLCPGGVGLLCGGNYSQVNVAADPAVMVTDGYMTLPGSLSVYECLGKKRCSGERSPFLGVESPPMCGAGLSGPGCAACGDEQYFAEGVCKLCSETSVPVPAIVFVLICSLLYVCVFLYYGSMFPPNPVTGAYMPVIAFYQSLNLSLQMAVPISSEVKKILEGFAIFEFDPKAVGFPSECVVSSTPISQYASRVLWPIPLVLCFLTLYFATYVVPAVVVRCLRRQIASPVELVPSAGILHRTFEHMNKASLKSPSQIPFTTRMTWFWRAKWDNIFNAILKTGVALYIMLTKSGMLLFSKMTHPGGALTLTSMPDVAWLSREWMEMLPFSIFALLCFTFFIFAYIAHCVIVAPRRFPIDPHFRTRNRGIWAKFNPEDWWFCIIGLVYSLCINMMPAIFDNGRSQVMGCILATAAYVWTLEITKPFKYQLNYQADLFCKFGYLCFVMCCSVILPDKPLEPDQMKEVMYFAGISPAVVVFALISRFMWFRDVAQLQALEKRMDTAYRFMDIVKIVGHMHHHKVRGFCLHLLDTESNIISEAMDVLSYNLFGLQPIQPWKRYCGTKPYEEFVHGRYEGELLAQGLDAPDRRLFRTWQTALLNKSTAEGSELKKIKFKGLRRAEDVERMANTLFHGSLEGCRDFTEQQLIERMLEMYPGDSCPLSNSQVSAIFRGLHISDDTGGDIKVDLKQFAVQMSSHPEPVFPSSYKPDAAQVQRYSQCQKDESAQAYDPARITTCPSCGLKIKGDSIFCRMCGASRYKQAKPQQTEPNTQEDAQIPDTLVVQPLPVEPTSGLKKWVVGI